MTTPADHSYYFNPNDNQCPYCDGEMRDELNCPICCREHPDYGKPSVGSQFEGVASRRGPDARETGSNYLGGCRNCGDPIVEEGFCGMCREMGCGGAVGSGKQP